MRADSARWAGVLLAALTCGTLHADVVTRRLTGKALKVLPVQNGKAVLRFDLSDLPRGAIIYRADVLVFRTKDVDGRLDEARVDIEVRPLFAELRAGKADPKGKPLRLRRPWYDRLDATDAVRQWAAGRTNGGFFVKTWPFCDAPATCLDVWYDGTPENRPKQVAAVRAFHRAGQTFITWTEITDPVGADPVTWGKLKGILDGLDKRGRLRYCVYRHTERIRATNLHEAELIATVRPLSCWNVNGRNIDRPVDDFIATSDVLMVGHWNPFGRARLDGRYGRDCVMDRLVVRDGGKPLPPGTGLYVHTVSKDAKAYYAVLTSLDGVQNTRDVSGANSPAEPVAEQAGAGEPVLQRRLPRMRFFNFPQTRLHYVRWVAPPYVNIPSQYYNWSVGVPDKLGRSASLELNLHRDGHSYWRTHYRIERDSVVLCPHDFPVKTWWYGYHESVGTLRSFKEGAIQPYTERRLLAFIDWAAKKWPVDRDRILVTGCRGGASGSGALHLGLRHPKVFNLVICGHPTVDYAAASRATDKRGRGPALSMQAIWGKADWNLKAADGRSFWDRHDLTRLVQDLPATADLPYVAMTSSHRHPAYRKFYEAMLTKHFGIMAEFNWGGARYIPVSSTGTFPNVIRLDIRRNRPLLAFVYPKAMKLATARSMGDFNRHLRWRDFTEDANRFEVTVFRSGRGDKAADVVPRRLRKFRIEPGKTYVWKTTSLDGKTEHQKGEAAVGDDGLLVLKGVTFSGDGSRLVVTPKQ